MKELIMKKQSAHWYTAEGSPAYEVPSADGKKMVKTTLTQARKMNLLPSVTSVFKVLNKEALNAWRIEQMFDAVFNNPIQEGESIDDYKRRIADVADSISLEARTTGDKIHKYCEFALSGANPRLLDRDIPEATKDAIDKFMVEHVTEATTEKLCTNVELGYAGRVDCVCKFNGEPAIVDWKSQKTTDKYGNAKDPVYYDEMVWQGSAYCKCEGVGKFVNVIISSTEPGRIEFKEWSVNELTEAWEVFKLLLSLFKKINKLA
jgi:ATP-dependent exoDNAse (exonuclease V) beta subunit